MEVSRVRDQNHCGDFLRARTLGLSRCLNVPFVTETIAVTSCLGALSDITDGRKSRSQRRFNDSPSPPFVPPPYIIGCCLVKTRWFPSSNVNEDSSSKSHVSTFRT